MRETVPKEFSKGESLTFKKSFADYPASSGWTLVYNFRGAGTGFNQSATADVDDFIVTIAAATTEATTAGRYYYQGFASKGAENILVDSGEVNILPALAAITVDEIFDGRSQVKKDLDAVEALLRGKLSKDQQSYVIRNRQLVRIPIPELRMLRDDLKQQYYLELRAEQRKAGEGGIFKNHRVWFRQPR